MAGTLRKAAREAESTTALRGLARAGFAANGVVHILIGVLVLIVAFGGDGETDQAGAFKAVAAAPAGFALLWVIAIALWGLAFWHGLDAFLAWGSTRKKWGLRASEGGQALVFAALGVIAAAVALGAKPDADESAETASRGILAVPGGVFLLGAIGVGVAIAGISFIVMGVRRSFHNKMDIPSGPLGTGVSVLGTVGFVAKGVALGIIGVLLIVAAVKVDPGTAGGLDAAVQTLFDLPMGPWLAGIVGSGLIAYGVFCGFRARYARL
ncbi:DUF1206 domain-containing protein [Microbacterium sp. W1N]|uniref:DUF1206 domain-containing protein n=1 Tax=Microbacterium festucae TaxID=2977531 RepID=UPI0021C015E4|nr:DUF1206 domain-containing protein [Microbacterium festucae]MCT9821565.1 DUF1206 domain-containing protein [Microbacterium festucae]